MCLRYSDPQQKDPAYLTTLVTPCYYTLKHRDDKVSRVYHPGNNPGAAVYPGDDFYDVIAGHYPAAALPAFLQQDPALINNTAAAGRMVVNQNRLPGDLSADSLICAIDDSVIALDNYFDEDGFGSSPAILV